MEQEINFSLCQATEIFFSLMTYNLAHLVNQHLPDLQGGQILWYILYL